MVAVGDRVLSSCGFGGFMSIRRTVRPVAAHASSSTASRSSVTARCVLASRPNPP